MAIIEKYKAWLDTKLNGPRRNAEEEHARLDREEAERDAEDLDTRGDEAPRRRMTGGERRT